MMNDAVQELIKISRYAGMREDLVQTGGGNSSVKLDDDTMYIKSMGVQMAEMREEFGYSTVRLSVFRSFLEQNKGSVSVELGEELQNQAYIDGERPAIETFFHAITDRVTLHTHPIVVGALACRKDGMELIKRLFPEAILVNYASPGLPVAWEYYQQCALTENGSSRIAFLKNHGLIVSGANAQSVIDETERVVSTIALEFGYDGKPDGYTTDIFGYMSSVWDTQNDIIIRAKAAEIVSAYTELANSRHTVCPDCVVFCGAQLLVLPTQYQVEAIQAFYSYYGKPNVILYSGHVYIVAPSMRKVKEIESVLLFCASVLKINNGLDMDLLTDTEVNFLLNWEVEKYRSNMNL